MQQRIALIGYGEAASTFARAARWRSAAAAFDLRPLGPVYAADGVRGCVTLAEALDGAAVVISLVTADQALVAARDAARHIAPDALYLDMNSVAPDTKMAAAEAISAVGGRYADVAIMAPVDPARLAVPLLVAGPPAEPAVCRLGELGFTEVRAVGDAVGRASMIKMLRSVMYKGVEALTAECLIACARAGVTEEVIASFGGDWAAQADYRLDRMLVHGTRRAAEMTEATKTLEALGVEPLLTRGTAQRQAELGMLGPGPNRSTLAATLERLAAA